MVTNNDALLKTLGTTNPEHLRILQVTLSKFAELGCSVQFVPPMTEGPRLLYFGLRPASATKVSMMEGLASDLAVALGVEDVLVKRMPGHGVVGISIPRKDPQLVRWVDLLSLYDTRQRTGDTKMNVPLVLGVTQQGHAFIDDLTTCPHLLIAGSTGGGKSVLIRSLVATITNCCTRDEVLLVLSDTKGVEFNDFDKAHNLWQPRATTASDTCRYLDDLCTETDYRMSLFCSAQVKNIKEFNSSSRATTLAKLPYIVIVIDELADIVEYTVQEGRKLIRPGIDKLDYITRKSRAAGVHVIAAVQRPSVDIVKGVIKNNFPARLTFKMPSMTDSRTVIDTEGAEHLLGVGDCLYKGPNIHGLVRLHTGMATTSDIKGVLEYVNFRQQQEPDDTGMGHSF